MALWLLTMHLKCALKKEAEKSERGSLANPSHRADSENRVGAGFPGEAVSQEAAATEGALGPGG